MTSKAKPIPSKAFKSCHDCDKEFSCFRLRYRCDKCQFCYCNLHLKTIIKENKKKLRLCELCLENSKVKKLQETLPMMTESDSGHDDFSEINSIAEPNRKPEDAELDKYSKIKNFLNEIQSEQFNFFMKHIYKFASAHCEKLVSLGSLSSTWTSMILQCVEETCRSVCPSVAILADHMNICEYVKVFKVRGDEDSVSYLKAAVLDKQCAYKRIRKEILACRVVIIKGATWFYLDHKRIVSITDIINQEKQYIVSLFKTLSDLKPNIILLEKNMPQKLIKKLEAIGIGVFMNIHIKRLHQIARITQAKILSTLLDSDDLEDSVGTCKKFEEVKVGDLSLSFFFDDKKSVFTGSVIIRAKANEDMEKVAGIIKKMSILYRNLLLERNLCWHLGMKSKKNIFKQLHKESLCFNFVSVGMNRLCQHPVKLNINFYSDNDMSLGKHLISMFISNHMMCDICMRLEIGKHCYYYISDHGRVKLTLEKEESRNNYEIGVYKECLECENIGNFSYVSQSIWEYSFHKFISNFFVDGEIRHNEFSCQHDSLKACRYNFVSQGIKATFEYQENNRFTLLPVHTAICESGLRASLLSTFHVAKDSIKRLISYLLTTIEQSELKENEKSDLTPILKSLLKEIGPLEITPNDSIFSLEAYRKYYFSQICLSKLKYEAYLHLNYFPEKKLKIMSADDLSLSLIEFPIVDNEKILASKDFFNLLAGQINLFSNLCQKSMPLYENDPFSILAYTLASVEYSDNVMEKFTSFNEIEEALEYELYNSDSTPFIFSQSNYEKSEYENHEFKSDIPKLFGSYHKYKIKLFYPKPFFHLASAVFPSFTRFIESLSRSFASNPFKNLIFSHDSKFVLKQVPQDQFQKFLSFAPNYFRHEIKSIFHKMPSSLIRIFGAIKLSTKEGKTLKRFFILQENLAGLTPTLCKSYKIRPKTKEKISDNLQNSAFFNDFCGLPLLLLPEMKKIQDAGIWNDTLFLSKNNVMNYSLVVKANQEDLTVAAGIGDYFDQLTVEKAIENKYKLLLGNDSINPHVYKELFREEMMKTYFASQ